MSLRLFNVYGPRTRTSGTYGAVLGVFLAQKINNKPFTVVGDGNQTRDFTYVTDITDGFYKAAKSNVENEIMFGTCSLKLLTRELETNRGMVELSDKEFSLLKYFLRNRGIIISKQKLSEEVWELPFSTSSNVDSLM